MLNPPLYVRLSKSDLEKSVAAKAYVPEYKPIAGTRTIPLQTKDPKENWSPEHHLAHHLMGMDFHKRNTPGPGGDPTKSQQYQTHLRGAHQAISSGADMGKVSGQHYSEAKAAFPSHIRGQLGKSDPGLYIGG